jgi:MFS family permease
MLSGTAAAVAWDFMHPELILAGLIYTLTSSALLVALVSIVDKVGMLGPQLLVGSRTEHQSRKRPYFIAITAIRAVALTAMVLAMWRMTTRVDGVTLGFFFLSYLAVRVCGGIGHVLFLDMAGRMIPSSWIGTFLGMRQFLGGTLSVVAGIAVIQPILERVTPVWNYVLLATIGSALAVIDMTLFSLCKEEAGPRARRRTTIGESLRRGMRWVRTDRNYRMYLWLRVAYRFNYLGLAFFIPYGSERLGYEGRVGGVAILGGIMVATMKLSRVIASAVWGRVSDRCGFKVSLVGAGVCFVLAPILALTAPVLPRAFSFDVPGTEAQLDLPLSVLLLALAAMGIGMQGNIIAGSHFLIRNAPPHRRVSYVGFLNTVTSPLALLPFAGAWVAASVGVTWIFAAIVIGGALSLVGALRMVPGEAQKVEGLTISGEVSDQPEV